MKVILTQELKGKGGEGDVVDVARGFAVNYLLPRRLAVEATPGNLKQLEARQGNIQQREETRLAEASGLAGALDGKSVKIEAKVGEGVRLYGSITSSMVMDAIAEQLATDVDRRKIDVHGYIKELGEHIVTVQVYREVKAEITVKVVPAGGEVAEPEPTPEAVIEQALAEADAADEVDEAAEAEITEFEEEAPDEEPEAEENDTEG